MHLRGPPLLGISLERNLARVWIDVLPGDHRGRDLIEPAHGVEFAIEVARMLPTCRVAISRAPPPVGPLVHMRHCPATIRMPTAR